MLCYFFFSKPLPLLFRKFVQNELFATLPVCQQFLDKMAHCNVCSEGKSCRLLSFLRENSIMTLDNARFASNTFAALFEWVIGIAAASLGPAVIHCVKSKAMIEALSRHSCNLDTYDVVEICFF